MLLISAAATISGDCLTISQCVCNGLRIIEMKVSGEFTSYHTVNASFYVFPNFKFPVIVNLINDNLHTFVYNYFQIQERK